MGRGIASSIYRTGILSLACGLMAIAGSANSGNASVIYNGVTYYAASGGSGVSSLTLSTGTDGTHFGGTTALKTTYNSSLSTYPTFVGGINSASL